MSYGMSGREYADLAFTITVAGLIGVALFGAVHAVAIRPHEIEEGRQIGLCEARGGRIIDGVCAKVETLK